MGQFVTFRKRVFMQVLAVDELLNKLQVQLSISIFVDEIFKIPSSKVEPYGSLQTL